MPQFTTRYEGVSSDHLAWMLVALDGRIDSRMDDQDYRLHEEYLQRAQLRYGAGFPAYEVLDDLYAAAKCLRFKEDLHFSKVPVERFRPRRILPIELGILGGEMRLMRQLAEGYGVPVSPLVADMATDALKEEVGYLTRYFHGYLRDDMDLAGLAALMYAAALAAVVREFDDEAMLAVRLFRHAKRSAEPSYLDNPHVIRYDRLLTMIEALVKEQDDDLVGLIADTLRETERTLREGMTPEQWVKPPGTPNYMDLSAFCFQALTTYRERELDLDLFPEDLASHKDMMETLATPMERDFEVEDEQARAKVEELLEDARRLQDELQAEAEAKLRREGEEEP